MRGFGGYLDAIACFKHARLLTFYRELEAAFQNIG